MSLKEIFKWVWGVWALQGTIAVAGDLQSSGFFYDVHYYRYSEPGFMNENSRLPAISIGFRDESALRQPDEQRIFAGTLEASFGPIRYRGSGERNSAFYKFLAELYYPVYKDAYLVYAGLGYRMLFDNLGPGVTTTGAGGYDRLSQYVYIPIGVFSRQDDGSGLKAQFNLLARGRQKSFFTQIAGYGNDPENDQKTGYGLEFSYTTPDGGWEVYARHWGIRNSSQTNVYRSDGTQSGTAIEPENTTTEVGVRFAF